MLHSACGSCGHFARNCSATPVSAQASLLGEVAAAKDVHHEVGVMAKPKCKPNKTSEDPGRKKDSIAQCTPIISDININRDSNDWVAVKK